MGDKFTVVDIDAKQLSANTLAFLFPERAVETATGGFHLYLPFIGAVRNRKGDAISGDAGQVVLPLPVDINGKYEWAEPLDTNPMQRPDGSTSQPKA